MLHAVDLATATFPGSAVAAVLLGTVGGMGGAITTNVVQKLTKDFNTPSELSNPSWTLRSAFYSVVTYYICTDPGSLIWTHPLLSAHAGRLAVISFLIVHTLSAEIIGHSFLRSLFDPIESVLATVFRIRAIDSIDNAGTSASTATATGSKGGFNSTTTKESSGKKEN